MSKGFKRPSRDAAFGNTGDTLKVIVPVRGLALTVSAAGAAVGFGNAAIAGLPTGYIVFLAATSQLRFTTTSVNITNAAFTSQYCIGTGVDANGTMDSNAPESNIIDPVTNGAATAKVTPIVRGLSLNASGVVATPLLLDNTAGTLKLNLNMSVTAADIADSTSALFTVDGVVKLAYLVL